MLARAPASSANLGPGFDVLAVAIDLHVEVSVVESDRLEVVTEGEGAELPADAGHLAARIATAVAGHDRLAITVRSQIPVGRGLGSSAALAVAAAAAAGAPEPLLQGVEADGHADNAAASAHGGLVAVAVVDGRPVVRSLPLDPQLCAVLVVPDASLPTVQARGALAATVPHADAVFNLGRLALLVAGLADHRCLIVDAFDDRLHQDARAALFPQAPALLGGLRAAGALGACWSGAGPTLLAMTTLGGASTVAGAAGDLLESHGVAGRVVTAGFSRQGVITRG
ncbi:MAG TPA: homoserine kinase [Acidimicrobiales bacterium]|nr:homoserine kinase [Acidimicrobiales bacterium]